MNPLLRGAFAALICLQEGEPDRHSAAVRPSLHEFGAYDAPLEKLAAPSALAWGKDDRLYVADTGNHRVAVFRPDGNPVAQWGVAGSGPGAFLGPEGIAVADGRVFVSDTGNGRVQVFDEEGKHLGTWPGLERPRGLSVTGGRVCVAEAHRVRVFTPEGKVVLDLGPFTAPAGVAFEGKGNLYVSDTGNHRVRAFDPEGKLFAEWGGWGEPPEFLSRPGGIVWMKDRLAVADTGNHRIQFFDAAGALLAQWGAPAATAHTGNGWLHAPAGLALSPSGDRLAVCEPLENRVQIFSPAPPPLARRVTTRPWWHAHRSAPVPVRPETSPLAAMADADNHFVYFFDVTKNVSSRLVFRAGGYGRKLGEFNGPAGVAYDPATRRAVVSDRGNRRVQVIELPADPSRGVRVLAAFEPGRLAPAGPGFQRERSVPGGVALDAQGNIYVVDSGNAAVLVFDAGMKFVRTLHRADEAPALWEAVGVSPDGKTVAVTDALAARVFAFEAGGRLLRTLGEGLRRPSGVAVDAKGNVYVADALLGEVLRYDSSGAPAARWGGRGIQPGKFCAPGAIALLGADQLLVDDAGNHRGQGLTLEGKSAFFFSKEGAPLLR